MHSFWAFDILLCFTVDDAIPYKNILSFFQKSRRILEGWFPYQQIGLLGFMASPSLLHRFPT